jgi:hypothetical protein
MESSVGVREYSSVEVNDGLFCEEWSLGTCGVP